MEIVADRLGYCKAGLFNVQCAYGYILPLIRYSENNTLIQNRQQVQIQEIKPDNIQSFPCNEVGIPLELFQTLCKVATFSAEKSSSPFCPTGNKDG